jgi:hypothetical protein
MSDDDPTVLQATINTAKKVLPEPPRPLMRATPSPHPFPVDALGDVLGRAACAIHDRIRVPMAIAGNSVLATGALAAQGHADIELPIIGQIKPLSLFIVTVAESGERKTSSDDQASWPVREREKELREAREAELFSYENDLAAWEKAREAKQREGKGNRAAIKKMLDELGPRPVAPPDAMLTCPEPTYEGLCKLYMTGWPSLGIYSDEAGLFIGGHGLSDEAKLRTAAGLSALWDRGVVRRVRAGDGAVFLPGRRLSLHLMAQPDVGEILFGDPLLLNQGLLSRVLVSAPERAAGTRLWREEHPVTDADLKRYGARLLGILKTKLLLPEGRINGLRPRVLKLSPAARRRWIQYSDRIELAVAPGGELEPVCGLACKLAEHAARLAGNLSLVDDPDATEIIDPKLEAGIALADHFAAEALRLFGTSQIDGDLKLAQKLLQWLWQVWKEPNVSLPDIYQLSISAIRTKAKANRMVDVLVDHAWLERLPEGAVIRGFRRRDAWRVVPAARSE